MDHYQKVKHYLLDLGHEITQEQTEEQIYVVSDESKGVCNMILNCEGDLLIMEQHIFDVDSSKPDVYKRLLQINRTLIHGAFVLDETGNKVLFRDTLQLPTLDLNELESSINSLALALMENTKEILGFAAKTEKVA